MATLTKRPIQVRLEERQEQALRRLASEEGVSLSELIRRGVDLLLSQVLAEEDPAWRIIGLGNSGVGDLGMNHDKYLSEETSRMTP